MKRSAFGNKAKPKPTSPRNPSRERNVPPRPESPPTNPVRETKILGGGKVGVRLEVMQGKLPDGFNIVSHPDGDSICWNGAGKGGVGYVSMRVTLGLQRGRKA